MNDPAPIAYGRDASGRFTAGNRAGQGRLHAFAKQAAALRKAFFAEVTPADMRALVRTLVTEATGGNLQAARLVMLWILGKPHEPVHPDAIQTAVEAAAEAAAQADTGVTWTRVSEQPRPADRAARERLAQEIRATRGLKADPVAAEEDLEHPC